MIYPIKPLNGIVIITQRFGEDPTYYKRFNYKGHNGLDFRAKIGTPIFSVWNGKISVIGDQGSKGWGKFVKIAHGGGTETLYAHLSQFKVSKVGKAISGGSKIGLAGNTGNSRGSHLHFGLRWKNWKINNGYGGYTNPLPALKKNNPKVKLSFPYDK